MPTRLDVGALKRAHPVAEVVAGHGVTLRPVGASLVGFCPFHADRHHPNLHVFPATGTWHCFRCGAGGDAIAFVMRRLDLPFRAACAHLGAIPSTAPPASRPLPRSTQPAWVRGPDELACLAAAVDHYRAELDRSAAAGAYLRRRGLDQTSVDRHRLGYASGRGLAALLLRRGLTLASARRVGLFGRGGVERFAGRVVVPELRGGRPVWLIGRVLGDDAPRYLALPGPKPLVGWEEAARHPTVWLVEGVFDFLLLRRWGLPALCLLGTRARPAVVAALRRFERVYLALDDDPAGRDATAALVAALGPRAAPVRLPGVADVGELADHPDGRRALLAGAPAGRPRAA